MKIRATLYVLLSLSSLTCPKLMRGASVNLSNLTGLGRLHGVNQNNQFVGNFFLGDGLEAFIYQNGVATKITVPGAEQTAAYGIENNGRLVGSYIDDKGVHGFVYFHGEFTTINADTLGAKSTVARGINDPQRIVGYYRDVDGVQHGFLFANNEFTRLDFPGALTTSPIAINNPGDIVGDYVKADDPEHLHHGFLYDKGGAWTTIDVPFAGATDTFLYGINSAGIIVGSYKDDSGTHGFIDVAGVFTSFDAPDTPPGIGTLAQGIGDNGQILVFGTTAYLGSLIP